MLCNVCKQHAVAAEYRYDKVLLHEKSRLHQKMLGDSKRAARNPAARDLLEPVSVLCNMSMTQVYENAEFYSPLI